MIFMWALFVAAAVSNVSGSRIIGGDITSIANYPYLGQVDYRIAGIIWSQFGGASILNRDYVLTAAQNCDGILYSDSNRRLRFGTSQREANGEIRYLAGRINHYNHDIGVEYDSDICLMRLAQRLVYGPNIAACRIPNHGYEFPAGQSVTAAGWGVTASQYSSSLRHVELTVIGIANCTQIYQSLARPRLITNNMICTTGLSGVSGASAAEGDFGGPIVSQGIVLGITVFPSVNGLPGISTKVSSFTNWVVNMTSSNTV